MTLLKKLLPIASVASVAAVVAPLATSCGAGTTFDGTQIYLPTIAIAQPEEGKTYNDETATDLYFEHLAENPEIYAQDMKAAISRLLYNYKHMEEEIEFGQYKVSLDYSHMKVDKENHKFSFTLNGSADIQPIEASTYIKISSFSYTFNNIPFIVRNNNNEYGAWTFQPDILEWTDDMEISFKTKGVLLAYLYSPIAGDMASFTWQFINRKITINKDTDFEKLPYEEKEEYIVSNAFFATFLTLGSSGPLDSYYLYHMSAIPYGA